MDSQPEDVTVLLNAVRAGDAAAKERLITRLYPELKTLAQRRMRLERPGHTLGATGLLHEYWMKVAEQPAENTPTNRRHFFAAAAEVMRHILVDHARARRTDKRGGDRERVPLDDLLDDYRKDNLDVLALHETINDLTVADQRWGKVLDLRYFGGLEIREIAENLRVSEKTVHNDHKFGLAWMRRRMQKEAT